MKAENNHKPLTREKRDQIRSEYSCGPIRASGVSRDILCLLDDLDAKDAAFCFLNSELVKLRAERDEAHGDAEREYGMRMLAEKARIKTWDQLESILEALRSVLSEDGVKEYLSAYTMGVELIERIRNIDTGDAL